MPSIHPFQRSLWAALLAVGLAACGGGGGDDPAAGGSDAGSGGGSGNGGGSGDGGTGGGTPESRVYIGYYAEDPQNNPEDPTVGVVMFRVPAGDGAFSGQMPFSYVGCSAGVDTGAISGARSGNAISGSWSGVMDGAVPVGGALQATLDAAENSFTGTFTNAAGKVEVRNGPCQYYIAAGGSFKVWGEAARQPAGFAATAGASTTPTFGWTALGAGTRYTVRLFGYACVQADPGNPDCFVGESLPTAGLGAAYPGAFTNAVALQAGTEYLAVVTGQNPATGAFAGFTSVRFTP